MPSTAPSADASSNVKQKLGENPVFQNMLYSELTADIEADIKKAYDASLGKVEQERIRAHLSYILTRLQEPNSLIEPIKHSLSIIEARQRSQPSWKEWLIRPVVVGIITLAVTAPISIYIGIEIEKRKSSPDCERK